MQGFEQNIAVWRQIEAALARAIETGAYGPGERMPTESALAARFGANRHTVRRAVGALSEQGRVRVEQGRGTFVAEDVLHYPLGNRTRFTRNVAAAMADIIHVTASITEALARLGVTDYRRSFTGITARLARADETRHLQIPANRPVLETESVDVDNAPRPVGYGLASFAADRVQLVVK